MVDKLSLDEVREALDALKAEGVEALAVCFLYSFVDPTHERLVEAEIRARFPGPLRLAVRRRLAGVP